MKDTVKYRVSFHVSHPSLTGAQILKAIGLLPKYVQSIGENRVTWGGKPLEGVYTQTNISFKASNGVVCNEEVELSDFIRKTMDSLPLEFINELVESGGENFFLVGIFTEGNVLYYFDADLLFDMSKHGIGLKLDFYGGPEQSNAQPEGI